MSSVHDVVVIGAGAMGSSAACALARAGREVVVVEQHQLGHALGGSHGGSRLFRLDYSSEESLALAQRADLAWQQLEDECGETLLDRVGGVEHGMRAERLESAQRWCAKAGVRAETLGAEAAGERWPEMRFEDAIVYQPDAGRLYADRAVGALQRLASDAGAELRPLNPVRDIEVLDQGDGVGGGLVEVRTAAETLRARQVVAAVGSWAPGLLGDVVALPPIVVTQEQPRHFRALAESSDWPVFVHWRGQEGDAAAKRSPATGVNEPGVGVKVGHHRSGPAIDPGRA